MQTGQTILLSDGRTLGYAEYGSPVGEVFFFMHGQPGNRLFHPDPVITHNAGVRLIIPDRPGYGLSTDDPTRTILSWPQDLLELADQLAVKQFGLIGFSAGGPYAIACGAAFPEKIARLLLISSAPPLSNPSLRKKMPFLVRLNYWALHLSPKLFYLSFRLYWPQARKNPHHFIRMARKQSSLLDQKVLDEQDVYQMIMTSWEENLRRESTGYAKDAELLLGDWGFDLRQIDTEVLLWWGEHDRNSPTIIQENYAELLPNSQTIRKPNAGHFGFLSAWEEICELIRTP